MFNPNITIDIIRDNITYPWPICKYIPTGPYRNEYVNEWLESHKDRKPRQYCHDKYIKFIYMTNKYDQNLSWEELRPHLGNKKMRYKFNFVVQQSPMITWENILEMKAAGINLDGISRNPNLTYEIVRDNQDIDWDWSELSSNLFNLHPYIQRKDGIKIANETIADKLIPGLFKSVIDYL